MYKCKIRSFWLRILQQEKRRGKNEKDEEWNQIYMFAHFEPGGVLFIFMASLYFENINE
jgi:hypothetical protein